MQTTEIPRESFLVMARYRKAAAIAAVLNEFHTPADVVGQFTQQRRRQVEHIAGVKVSSDITWGVVALIMHHQQGTPITTRPMATITDIHDAIKDHAAKHADPKQGKLPT